MSSEAVLRAATEISMGLFKEFLANSRISSEKVAEAYREAAAAEAERAGIAHSEQLDALSQSNDYLAQLVELSQNDGDSAVAQELSEVARGMTEFLARLRSQPLSAADSNAFVDSRI